MTFSGSSVWNLEPILISALSPDQLSRHLALFSQAVWTFYQQQPRCFPWRETSDPYAVLLSELMLQQTQTERVLPKYEEFLAVWPDFQAMAASSLLEVLARWKGLGYNRRALALRSIASATESFGWTLPEDYTRLLQFPMIGPSTAAAILAFCYDRPSIYLETNIRRVLIHQFFPGEEKVVDKDLRPILQRLVDVQSDFKHWYYALMDLGVHLKKNLVNPNRRSAHYVRQGRFENSNRQLRGMLLLLFTERGRLRRDQLYESLAFEPERIDECLEALRKEGFVQDLTGRDVALSASLTAEEGPWYGIPSNSD
jgi:A/G-specific adenine glycosylase